MTEVMFHVNVAERIGYACRLLRKGVSQGATIAVCAPAPTLGQLDALLWTSDPTSFVAHARLAPGAPGPAASDPTPIWLVERAEQAPVREVLVNLGDELAAGFESFGRVIEIVAQDDEARRAARLRWKHYADRGYVLRHHEADK